jgi:hypothetical protein
MYGSVRSCLFSRFIELTLPVFMKKIRIVAGNTAVQTKTMIPTISFGKKGTA